MLLNPLLKVAIVLQALLLYFSIVNCLKLILDKCIPMLSDIGCVSTPNRLLSNANAIISCAGLLASGSVVNGVLFHVISLLGDTLYNTLSIVVSNLGTILY